MSREPRAAPGLDVLPSLATRLATGALRRRRRREGALAARGARRSLGERLFLAVGGAVLYAAVRFLGWTTRKTFVGAEELFRHFAAGEQVILSFWHGRMVMMPFAYRGRGACIMNSQHRDGALVSRVIRRFGIEVVRGSSTRGWVGGLRGLLAAHARGRDLVVVPDGPRGPRCRVKSGVIQLARVTGAPIVAVSQAATRARTLRGSWDWLTIPLPFSRVTYVIEEALVVPANIAPGDVERLRLELEERLNHATRRADSAAGIDPRITAEYLAR